MSYVFVVDTKKQPLNPVHPGKARLLLKQGRAAVWKYAPFTLILKTSMEDPALEPLRIKIDPGSKTTGLALVNDVTGQVVWAAELTHRGQHIKKRLGARRTVRRNRRNRKTRYRKPRFNNRRNQKKGWLPPSLESRVNNVVTWVQRLMRWCPIIAISQELVKFDLQHLQNPEISGIQYQQGTLAGYEIRAYLFEKWNRQCTYCGAQEVPLEVEHIQCRARGGTNRVSNLTLTCKPCNDKKGTLDIRVFLANKPERLQRLLAQAKAPLRDATAVNTTRWTLYERLTALGLPVERGSGGLTNFNRTRQGLPKNHWVDAACVGQSTPEQLVIKQVIPLSIEATRRGSRQMCLMDTNGFPRSKPKSKQFKHQFRTGDLVRAVVPEHLKHPGVHIGRMAAKANGSFTIATRQGKVTDIGKKYCRLLQKADGYGYNM